MPGVQEFIRRHPGTGSRHRGSRRRCPRWVRVQHFFNLFLMIFIIRAGVQILADHPRLYWTRHCTPGQGVVPRSQKPGARRSAVDGEAGLDHACRSTSGCRASATRSGSRAGGISASTCSGSLNGLVFYVLLFATGEWRRLVPTSWQVFPDAASVADPVPVAELAGRQQLGGLQRPADHRLLHHGLRRRAARA